MRKLFRRLGRSLAKSALRSIRNTFRYEAPVIGRFIGHQLRPQSPAPAPRPRKAPAARPATPPAPAAPKPARKPSIDRQVGELMALKAKLDATTSLEAYQDLSVRYSALLAEVAARSQKQATTVKAHRRDGHTVRRHKRSLV